ncbi:carbon-nitrogen hydrolase family protein [Cellulomonas sp. KRMCY2]|uniref:carbon-nitrogen hydrolase family protein n=1 Tax=Cellulomonas sp. KRMCY2 TaxID=1304865 RepID=UPI00045E7D00|nr:carbon-nitrogen hydrolase family protein [Cellulomonas sp. KRMCY2]
MTVRVHVAAQTTGLDPAGNRALAVAAVRGAADDGASLVVLPEYAARFDPRGPGPDHAEPVDGPFVTALQDVTRSTGVVVVAGTLLPGNRADRAVNAVVVVGPDGLAGLYRKVHLYDAFGRRESDRLEAGPADVPPVVVTVGDLHVGVMTCYDLRFPESARRLVDGGATVLVVPAAWAAGEHKADHWRTLLRARAIENTAYVLGAAQQGAGVVGDSLVVDPLGQVLAESSGPSPAVAELDPAWVAAVRERNPSLANRRYGVVPLDGPVDTVWPHP